jgi:2-keto-4-pentenoate hydratase/2-oxohepta-3-ene-1,7-dioic acid hydratase in catechol pathway
MNCIFGYTILHDLSARDVQFKDNQITLGKNLTASARWVRASSPRTTCPIRATLACAPS